MSVTIVTGAASGIGQHLVERLQAAETTVIAADIDHQAMSEYAAKHSWTAHLCSLDVRQSAEWERVVDVARSYGPIDVLMNVAGYLRPGTTHTLSAAEVDKHFDINTKGVIHGTRLVSAAMVEQGYGHIINIASIAALAAVPGLALYSASKHAVRAFSLAAAEELRPHGVSVSVVCPDAVQTPMLALQTEYDEAAVTFATPHLLTVEEVGDVILGRVLHEKPLEVAIPRIRQVIAHVANLTPGSARVLLPLFRYLGRYRQTQYADEGKS